MPFFLPFLAPLMAGIGGKVVTSLAVSAVGALASRALAPKQPTQTTTHTTTNSVDLAKLKQDSKTNGINYITALRNVGMGYSNSTQTTKTVMPQENIGGQIFGNAIGSIVQGVLSYDPYQSRQSQLSTMLMEKDLFSNPQKSNSTFSNGLNALGNGSPNHSGWEKGPVTVTNPWKFDNVNTDLSDAESIEARYGEVISEIGGMRNWISDYYVNNAPAVGNFFSSAFENLTNSAKIHKSKIGGW